MKKTKNELAMHNELVTNNLNLDLYQARVVAFLATSIFKTDTEFKTLKTNVKELMEITKLDSGEHYKKLRETLDNLRKKDVRIRKTHSVLETGFLSSVEYYDNGEIEIKFDDKLKPYYLELGGNFTTFQLEILLQFSSYYARKIYELSKMILGKHKGFLEIDLQELKEVLKIGKDKLKLYNQFKETVLDIAIEKINNNKTDIIVDIKPTSERNIKSLIFNVKKNHLYQLEAAKTSTTEEISEKARAKIEKEILKKEKEEKAKQAAEQERDKIINEKAFETFNKMTLEEKEVYMPQYKKLNEIVKKQSFGNDYTKFVLAKIKEPFNKL